MNEYFCYLAQGVEFIANLLTVLLGSIAVYGLIRKRRELSLAWHVFAQFFFNQRTSKVKGTLSCIDQLNFEVKDNRSEIFALFGQLEGQLKSMLGDVPGLAEVLRNMQNAMQDKRRFSEAKKRTIVHEIHGLLDTACFGQHNSVVENNDTKPH